MCNTCVSIRGCKGTREQPRGLNGAGEPRETTHASSQGKRKKKKNIAMAGLESYAAFRDENDVFLWMVFWDRERHACVMEEARSKPRDRVAMGGGKWETLLTDCNLKATSKGELSDREK